MKIFRNKRNLFIFISFIIFSILIISIFIKNENIIDIQPKILISDSRSIVSISAYTKNIFGFAVPFYEPKLSIDFLKDQEKVEIIQAGKNNLRLKAKDLPGEFVFNLKIEPNIDLMKVSIPIIPSIFDSDNDGFPDVVELSDEQDRFNFRKWFTMIALTQYYHMDDTWNDKDCAGLLRFCYREALRKHDNDWLSKKRFLYDVNLPDINKYNYPNVPLLGDKIFRTNSNSFSINDLNFSDSIFVPFVEAKYLKDCNLFFCPKIFKMHNLEI